MQVAVTPGRYYVSTAPERLGANVCRDVRKECRQIQEGFLHWRRRTPQYGLTTRSGAGPSRISLPKGTHCHAQIHLAYHNIVRGSCGCASCCSSADGAWTVELHAPGCRCR